MMSRFRLLIAALAMLNVLPVFAQTFTDADQSALSEYTLSSSFLRRCEAVVRDVQQQKIAVGDSMVGEGGLDAMAARLDAKPDMHAVLVAHKLSAREYLLGSISLVRAIMAARMLDDPEQAQNVDADPTLLGNVTFYRVHRAEIDALMKSADQPD